MYEEGNNSSRDIDDSSFTKRDSSRVSNRGLIGDSNFKFSRKRGVMKGKGANNDSVEEYRMGKNGEKGYN